MKRHAGFTLIEVMIVVVIVGVLAGAAFPAISGARQQQALEDGFTRTEAAFNGARDVARSELRCVTVAVSRAGVDAIVGTVHPCGDKDLYSPPYTDGVPTNKERELFSIPIDPTLFESFAVLEQVCAPPADCHEPPCHGFGDLLEFRTDGSTDASYVLRFVMKDGTEQLWDVHAATGTVRRRT